MGAVSMRSEPYSGPRLDYSLEGLRKRKELGRDNSYWRFDFPMGLHVIQNALSEAGRSCPNSNDRDDHVRALMHAIKNFSDYSALPVSTLDKFAKDRKLPIATDRKLRHRKRNLVQKLINADDNPNFEYFLDLPPELRLRVYDFYIAGLPLVLQTPAQPPLAKINRLIRREIIPPFYEQCTFQFSLISNWRSRLERSPHELGFPSRSWMFLHSLTADNLATIKKWVVDVESKDTGVGGVSRIEVHIDLNSPARVEFKRKWNHNGWRELSQEQTAALAAAILAIYQEPSDQKGKRKQSLSHIFAVRRKIEEAVLQRGP